MLDWPVAWSTKFHLLMKPASLTQKAADSTFTYSSSMMSTISSIAESPKVPLLASKTGIHFVIPKNRLSGALVPAVRAGGKSEHNDVKKEEDLKQPSRKTKWGPDLTLDPFVKRGRALALQTRAEQIAAQLETGNLEIDNDEKTRSPSPPPIYDSSGQRLNTREAQKREQLDVERREAIGECMRLIPSYKPPSGYKPVYKEAKLFIPVKDHPGYNFIGLILGPLGNTQKRMETETGTKIAIRGRAVKEGKLQAMRRDGKELDGGIEDLHVHIAADTWEKIDAAVALIQPLLTPVDEESNPQKQKQLRELAETNGTLWDHTKACSLCGETGHREWQCPKDNLATFQAKIFCRICGDGGHPTIDCPMKLAEGKGLEEYVNFLEELGAVNPSGQSQTSAGTHIPGVSGTETDANETAVSQPMLLTASGAKPMPTTWISGTTSSEPAAPGDMYATMGGGTGVTKFPPLFPPCGLPGRGGLNFFFPPFYHPGLTPLGGVAFFGGRPPFLGNGFHPMMGLIPPNMAPALRQMHRFPVPVHESALRQHPPVGPDTEHQPKFSSHELPGKKQGLNVTPSMPAEQTIHLKISQPNMSENTLPEIASSVHPPDTQYSSLLQPPSSLVTSTDFLPVARFAPPPVLYPLPDSEQGCVHVSASTADVFPPFHATSSPVVAQISSNSAFNSVQAGLSVSASPASLNSGPGIFRSSVPASPLVPPSSCNSMSPTLLVAPPRHPHSIQPRRASLPTSAPPVLSPCSPSSRLLPVPSVLPPPLPVAKSASMISGPPVPVRPLYPPPALPPPFMPSSVSPRFCGPALSSAPPPPQSLVPPSAPPQPRGPPPAFLPPGPVPSQRSYFDAFSQTIKQGPPGMFVTEQSNSNLFPSRILPPTNIRDPLIPHAHQKWLSPNVLQPSCKDTITPLPPQPSTISQHQLKMEKPVLPSAKPLPPVSAPPLPPPRQASSFMPYNASSGAQTAHVMPPVPLSHASCSLPFPGTVPANMQSPRAAGFPHQPPSPYSSGTVGSRAALPFSNPSASSVSLVVVPVITRPPGDMQRTLAGQSTKLSPSFSFLRHPTKSPQWRSAYDQMGAQPESQIDGNHLGPSNTILSALPSVRSASEALQRLNRPLVPPVAAVEKGGSENYDPLSPTVASASIGSVQSEPLLNNSPSIRVPVASIGLSGTIDVPGNRTGSGWLQVAGVTGPVGSKLAVDSLGASQISGPSQNMVRPPRTEEVDAEYAKLMASVGVT